MKRCHLIILLDEACKEKEEPQRQTREMKDAVGRTCMCEELNATKESNKEN